MVDCVDEKELDPLSKIKEVYDDGFAEINGNKYEFTVMTFAERRSVFAYFSTVQNDVSVSNFGFLDTPKFKEIERIILSRITLDGQSLSKGKIFDQEKYMEDYLFLINIALPVISYPFLKGNFGL